jgi:hypothetical protein
MYEGRLFWSDAERVTLLGLLLKKVGADRAVRLGNADVWRRAIRESGCQHWALYSAHRGLR